jgi:hypothetical protein
MPISHRSVFRSRKSGWEQEGGMGEGAPGGVGEIPGGENAPGAPGPIPRLWRREGTTFPAGAARLKSHF